MPAAVLALDPAEPSEDDRLLEHVDVTEEASSIALRALRAVRMRVRLRPDLCQHFDPTRLDVAIDDLGEILGAGGLCERLRDVLGDSR